MSTDCSQSVRPWIVALAALITTSCTNARIEQAEAARTALVGLPKATLLSCAGAPERSARTNDVEVYTYTSQRIVSVPDPIGPYWGPGWRHRPFAPWNGGLGYAGYDVRSYQCAATFTLRDGVVARVSYDGDASLSQCYAIVANCLGTPQ